MGGIWFKVLITKYGVVGNHIKGEGNRPSWWWNDLCGVREGVGMAIEGWFDDGLVVRYGDAEYTSFWFDKWQEGGIHRFRINQNFFLSFFT